VSGFGVAPLAAAGIALGSFWIAAIAGLSALERRLAQRERPSEPPGLAAFILRDATAAVTAWAFGAASAVAFAAVMLGAGLAAAGVRGLAVWIAAPLACAAAALLALLLWKRVAEAVPRVYCDVAAVSVLPFYLLLYPLRRPLGAALVRLYPPLTLRAGVLRKDDVEELAEGDDGDRLLDRDEREMISRVIHLSETVVREIMVPRIDIMALEASTPLPDVVRVIQRDGHSRLPVYRESVDDIVGFLYAKDLITHYDRLADLQLADLVRPAYFIPETKRVAELLVEMRSRRVYLAVVVDEYGGTAGMVTMEDVIEEVVGEIHDELDEEQTLVHPLGDGSYRVDAKVDLDDLNERLQVALPADEYDTLGGLLYGLAGKIPAPGERFEHSGLEFTVAAVRGKRITQVQVRPLGTPVPGPRPD
jgi:CBS domain containing-hemolysin-like protein